MPGRFMPDHGPGAPIGSIVCEILLNNVVESRAGLFARQLIASFNRFRFLLGHDLLGHRLGHRADTACVPLATIEEVIIPALATLIEAHNILLLYKGPGAVLCPWSIPPYLSHFDCACSRLTTSSAPFDELR